MAKVFEPTTINKMTLQNRLDCSANWEGMYKKDGKHVEKIVKWYREIAQGGICLVNQCYAFIRTEGKQLSGKMGIHTDTFAGDYEKLTDGVHDAGGQLSCDGGQWVLAI